MEADQLDDILQRHVLNQIKLYSMPGCESIFVGTDLLQESRFGSGLLKLICPGFVRNVDIDDESVEGLLNKVPQDRQPILDIDAVELGRRVDKRAQGFERRCLREDHALDLKWQCF